MADHPMIARLMASNTTGSGAVLTAVELAELLREIRSVAGGAPLPAFPTGLHVLPGAETAWELDLAPGNRERAEALAEAWGVDPSAAVNVAVSDAYDNKVGAMLDAGVGED